MLFLSVLVMVAVPAGQASAGGWAVTTLDPVPAARVGEAVPVGFVIRQHGVTPVQLVGDDGPDAELGIEVRTASGRAEFFPASASGPVGHYTADVVFREAGDLTWSVHQGWFGPQDLGVVTVIAASVAPVASVAAVAGAAAAGGGSVSRHDWPAPVRLGLPLLALGATAVAVGDAVRSRRRAAA
ncbi:MAG: hypothetical protein ABIR68_14810 [Ilumatobacteraceae bacterium]